MKKLVFCILFCVTFSAFSQVNGIAQAVKSTDYGTGLNFWPSVTVQTTGGGGETILTTTVTVSDNYGVVHHLVRITTISVDGKTITDGGYKQTD